MNAMKMALGALAVVGLVGGLALAHPHQDEDRAWLGVGLSSGDGDGVLVSQVYEDSPAEAAGLASGDRIVAVNGARVADASALIDLMKGLEPGDSVRLTVENDGDSRTVTATLDTWPDASVMIGSVMRAMPEIHIPHIDVPDLHEHFKHLEGLEGLKGLEELKGLEHLGGMPMVLGFTGAKTYMGVELHDPSDQLRDFFGAAPGQGVLVNKVIEGTPAESAGLRAGDLIVRVGDQDVGSSGEITSAIAGREVGDTVKVEVIRDQERRELEVTLGENPGYHYEGRFELRQEGHAPHIYQWRGLSDEQKESARKSMDEAREAMEQARKEWSAAMEQNRETIRKALEEAREQYNLSVRPRSPEIRDQIREQMEQQNLTQPKLRELLESSGGKRVVHV